MAELEDDIEDESDSESEEEEEVEFVQLADHEDVDQSDVESSSSEDDWAYSLTCSHSLLLPIYVLLRTNFISRLIIYSKSEP